MQFRTALCDVVPLRALQIEYLSEQSVLVWVRTGRLRTVIRVLEPWCSNILAFFTLDGASKRLTKVLLSGRVRTRAHAPHLVRRQ
jgi:hypothetical protein